MGGTRQRTPRRRAAVVRAGLVAAVALPAAGGCATVVRRETVAPPSSPEPAASSPAAPAAPTPSAAASSSPASTPDASAALPTAADLGPGWGTGSDQDHAAEGSLVYLWALTHCVPLASLATGSGHLDGPSFDGGFAALARRVPWVALSNNPDLGRTGQFQEQDITAYAGPTATYADVTAALRGCSTSPLPSRTVDLQPAAPPMVQPGVQVAAYRYSLGEMLAEILVLHDGTRSVVADVEDASSTAGQRPDPGAEAALVRTTARAVATALTR